jgi:hypothetical protein
MCVCVCGSGGTVIQAKPSFGEANMAMPNLGSWLMVHCGLGLGDLCSLVGEEMTWP